MSIMPGVVSLLVSSIAGIGRNKRNLNWPRSFLGFVWTISYHIDNFFWIEFDMNVRHYNTYYIVNIDVDIFRYTMKM